MAEKEAAAEPEVEAEAEPEPEAEHPEPVRGVGPLISGVQLDSDVSQAQKIQFGAMSATDSQAGAVDASAEALEQGANHNATLGALYCAEGANMAAQNSDLAGNSIKNCQDQFKSASEMQDMQKKLGNSGQLKPDAEVLAKEGSQITLGEFESNFGITGEEYIKRMLQSGGSAEELTSMLSPKLNSAKIEAALAAANAALAHDNDLVNVPNKKLPRQKVSYSLRDKLRSKLLQDISRAPASDSKVKHFLFQPAPKDHYGHLEPLENAFAAQEDTGEMTLFEVIHQKYSEVSVRMHR